MQKHFATGQSSGGCGHFQPDRSIYPRKKFRDPAGRDIDERKNGLAYSRLVWEVECKNGDPVEIRQRGKRHLRNNCTRLFLAANCCEPDENNDHKCEAAVVLWGKVTPSSNDISVVDAVSFRSIDLSDDHKNDFLEHRRDRLLGVSLDQWRQCPANESVAPASSTITIPHSGALCKVTKEPQVGGNRPHLLDGIEDGEIEDLTIDLPCLRQQFENALDDDDDEEDEVHHCQKISQTGIARKEEMHATAHNKIWTNHGERNAVCCEV